ncbi:hypothetical protein KK083_05045 [Fulvivirgaceae bacterium PWU4]|uniref:Uncharacterized protein n=1 Tax=Chryseosolibacter histidini TaxID=2782349 RepID=A0AAP2DIJ5_9BACT|nr:hypothetical protein [Chryseosolibacter histidini]MBT1696229.1 hypothetical protein [Chryseosolibacter histidini]
MKFSRENRPSSFYNTRLPLILLAVLITSLCHLSEAQVKQTHRYERKQKNSDEYFSIIALKEEGLALIRDKNKYNGNKKLWELILLDTALQEKGTLELEIEQRYPLIGYEHTKGHLYLLYRTGETNRNSFSLMDVDITQGNLLQRYEIKPELDFKLTHFSKVGANVVLGGYVSNEPAILIYEMADNQIKVIPGFFQKDNELVELRVNQNQTFNTVLIDRSLRSERKLVFRTFDETGKMLLEDIVPIGDDRSLQTSISSTLEREDLMVLGTWGDRQGKQSSGFFSLTIDPFSDQKINFLSFGELEHFTDYLNPKRAQRIKENAREDALEGRRPSFTNYVMPFKIEEHKEGFLLLAEVYHPSSNISPYYGSPYGSPYYNPYYYYNPFWPGYYPGMRMYRPYSYGNNVKNSDEIKTNASILVAFDSKGKPLWDHSIKMDELKKPSLEQVSDYVFINSTVYFLYKKESELHIKTINIHDGSANELVEKIKLNDPLDEIRSEKEQEDGTKHWVGNTFYTWGYQTIRNVQKKDDRVRDVFYINKVVVP